MFEGWPHRLVLSRSTQTDKRAILEQFRVVHCTFVNIDIDGWDRAVEGKGDLRQREKRKQQDLEHWGELNQNPFEKEMKLAQQSLQELEGSKEKARMEIRARRRIWIDHV